MAQAPDLKQFSMQLGGVPPELLKAADSYLDTLISIASDWARGEGLEDYGEREILGDLGQEGLDNWLPLVQRGARNQINLLKRAKQKVKQGKRPSQEMSKFLQWVHQWAEDFDRKGHFEDVGYDSARKFRADFHDLMEFMF
jgi:hypothetical protein